MSDLAKQMLGLSSKQIGYLVRRRRHREADGPASSLVLIQAGTLNERPLFFVHPTGGGVLCYNDFARYLVPEQSFYGLQAQGLDGKQKPYTKVEAMASHYVELIRAVQDEGPYLLGGWSGGGVIAFEMALQMEAQGQAVALLAMIDSYEPTSNHQFYAETNDFSYLLSFLKIVAFDLKLSLKSNFMEWDHLKNIEPDARLAYVVDKAKQANILPSGVELSQIQNAFCVFNNNIQAINRYVPRTYSGPIVFFKAKEQAKEIKRDLGWSKWINKSLKIQEIPGDHFSILKGTNIETLAKLFQNDLQKVKKDIQDGISLETKKI